MRNIEFREPASYRRMRRSWNGGGHYYSLADSPDVVVLDRDKNGMNIYGAEDGGRDRRLDFGLV